MENRFYLSKRAKLDKLPVMDPHGNCFFYSAIMVILDPDLTLIKGKHTKQHKEDTAHFWVRDKNGNDIDPTASQYEKGDLIGGEQIDVFKNIDYIIKDPLFKKLPEKIQKQISKYNLNKISNFFISKRAQMPAAMKTAESLYKIIQFLFFRVSPKNRSKFMSRLRGKLIRINPGILSTKKLVPSSSIGQSISFVKNILNGLSPIFTNQVLGYLSKLLIQGAGTPQQPLPLGVKIK